MITETTGNFSIGSDQKYISGYADIGVRWLQGSGLSLGISGLVGRAPYESVPIGVRFRVAHKAGSGRLEHSLSLYRPSSVGATGILIGGTYYPADWIGLLAQVDSAPTPASSFTRKTIFSLGLRLGEKPGKWAMIAASTVVMLAALAEGLYQ